MFGYKIVRQEEWDILVAEFNRVRARSLKVLGVMEKEVDGYELIEIKYKPEGEEYVVRNKDNPKPKISPRTGKPVRKYTKRK